MNQIKFLILGLAFIGMLSKAAESNPDGSYPDAQQSQVQNPEEYQLEPYPDAADPALRRFWECIGQSTEFENHYGGHVATGYNYYRVYDRAMRECLAFHAECIVECRIIN